MKKWIALLLVCSWLTAGFAQQSAPGKTECPPCPAEDTTGKAKGKGKGPQEDPEKAARAIRTLCERLGIGPGAVVAEVGCGKGADTMRLSDVVGATGTVYGQEISQKALDALMKRAKNERRENIVPALGRSEDPGLPDDSLDLIFMQRVFHHFANPGSMLSHLLRDLKPGAYLAIVDRERGPQREWPEMAGREAKHSWTGETTVVRLAREAGFEFTDEFDDFWPDSKMFVLVFRRPAGAAQAEPGDPDLPLPFDAAPALAELPRPDSETPGVLFLGIDRGRALLPALRDMAGPEGVFHDVLIEEWRTFEEELPPDRKEDSAELVRTAQGDLPELAERSLDAAVFADGYSRLWDPAPLLRRLAKSLKPEGYVAILDRIGPDDERRSLAGHRRRISPEQVKSDLRDAGFEHWEELETPAQDRFCLLFRLRKP